MTNDKLQSDDELIAWSVIDFLKIINKNDHATFYRGVSDCSYNLIPSIARTRFGEQDIEAVEKDLILRFRNESLPYLNNGNQNIPRNLLELMAIAQHHGLPTRLLDWSRSALVALFFATRDFYKNDIDGAVYMYSDPNIELITSDVNDLPNKVTFFMPPHQTARIKAQFGLFSVHPPKFEVWEPVEVKKIIIFRHSKEEIFNDLSKLGIKIESMFPDLDGICSNLRSDYGYRPKKNNPSGIENSP